MTVTRYDHIKIGAVITPEGWIRDKPIITRSGVFDYRDADGKLVREWRPEEEVFRPESLASLSGIPVTDGHNGLVSADNPNAIIGSVISQGSRQDNSVVADLVIHNPKKMGTKRELSLGYRAEIDNTPGVTPDGQRYDAKQSNIFYNHLAAVTRGRAGNARLRLDSGEAVSFDMEDDMADPVKLVAVRLDNGLEYQASPEVAQALAALVDAVKAHKATIDTLQAQADLFTGQATEVETVVAEVMDAADVARLKGKPLELVRLLVANTKGLPERMRARSDLEAVAKRHEVKFDAAITDRDLQIEVVKKLRGDVLKFDGKSDDYVLSAYDAVVATETVRAKKIGEQRGAANHRADSSGQPSGGSSAARSRMVVSLRAGRQA